MAGDDDSAYSTQVCSRKNDIAVPSDCQVAVPTERGLDGSGDLCFVAANLFDIDQRPQQRDRITIEVQVGHGANPTFLAAGATNGCVSFWWGARRDRKAAKQPQQPERWTSTANAWILCRPPHSDRPSRLPCMIDGATARPAWGWGLATVHESGQVLDTYFPNPAIGRVDDSGAPHELMDGAGADELRAVRTDVRKVEIDLDAAPSGASDAYLRLHLLSHRFVTPRSINLDGIFSQLANVVWTSYGPCAVDGFERVRSRLRAVHGQVTVYGVDKFPRMIDYVLPTGVRIADGDRVRLGAHLAEGTTVMHEGFVNYNAGTLGTSMVEGRISAGVVVGKDSDVGGGASIMGTLSGGGTQVISVGERCLLGANAGIGIALGDDCVVEAGLYVTAATKVTLPGGQIVKAVELSGQDSLLFLRNSVTGAIEVRPRLGKPVTLNEALHAN